MTPNSDQDEFVRAFEAAFARLQVEVEAACRHGSAWPEKVAAGLHAAFAFAADDPRAAQTLTSGALAHGRLGVERYEQMLEYMGRCLSNGRATSLEADVLPETTEKALLGGVSMLIAQRLRDGREAELASIVREATQLLLTPYLGVDAARRYARRLDNGAA